MFRHAKSIYIFASVVACPAQGGTFNNSNFPVIRFPSIPIDKWMYDILSKLSNTHYGIKAFVMPYFM